MGTGISSATSPKISDNSTSQRVWTDPALGPNAIVTMSEAKESSVDITHE